MENEIITKWTNRIMESTKKGERDKANVYKLVKAKLMEFVTQKNTPVLDEKAEIQILNKMVKERAETADVYTKVGRDELAAKEKFELITISNFLPQSASEEDIINAVNTYLSINPDTTKKDMGKVIKYVREQFDNVDGKLVSTIVSSKLS